MIPIKHLKNIIWFTLTKLVVTNPNIVYETFKLFMAIYYIDIKIIFKFVFQIYNGFSPSIFFATNKTK